VNLDVRVGLGRENRELEHVGNVIGGLLGGEMIGQSCFSSASFLAFGDQDILGGLEIDLEF
jgi:hypothetical protein